MSNQKIGITSDSSSSLAYAPFKHDVRITRTTIRFGEKQYMDGVDITADSFYDLLEKSDVMPSTAAPSPEEIIGRATELRDEGCTDVIHFPISFALSSYGENLLNLKDDYVEGVNYHVFNPRTGAMIEGYCAHYAEILAKKGYSVEEIFDECEKFVNSSCTYLLVDDLKFLVKGGRLNAASGLIGSLMRIKPILKLDKKGTIDPFEKVRTHAKAIERMFEIIKEDTKDAKEVLFVVQHSQRLEEGQAIKERFEKEFPNCAKATLSTITPTIGCHIGSHVIGMSYIILDNLKEGKDL